MEHPSEPRWWRTRPILVSTLMIAALAATFALAPARARTRVDTTALALAAWLWSTRWIWPLASVLTLVLLSSQPARRRWPRPAGRVPAALGLLVGLLSLASLATASRPRTGLLVLSVAGAIGLLTMWVLVLPRRLAPPVPPEVLDTLENRDRVEVSDARVKLQNDLLATPVQAIVGLTVLVGAILGFQQLTEDRQQAAATRQLTLQGQASERFTSAIQQLGSDRREVQLGGIYGLEQIAQQAPDNRLAVTEVLVAYLRRRAPQLTRSPRGTGGLASDAQAALTVLGRRQTLPSDPRLDLVVLDLRYARLVGADFRGADFDASWLNNADLRNVDLRNARLGADLREADFRGSDLRGARLVGASLDLADLRGADLRGASLHGADLSDARLRGADLRGAVAHPATLWPEGFDWQGAGVRISKEVP